MNIEVIGTGNDNRVAFWERNPLHPEGQAYVVHNGISVTVGDTVQVRRAIASGNLKLVAPEVTEAKPIVTKRHRRG